MSDKLVYMINDYREDFLFAVRAYDYLNETFLVYWFDNCEAASEMEDELLDDEFMRDIKIFRFDWPTSRSEWLEFLQHDPFR